MNTTSNPKKIGKIYTRLNTSDEPLDDQSSSVYGDVDMDFITLDGKDVTILEMCSLGNLDFPEFGEVDSYLKDKEFIIELIEMAGIEGQVTPQGFSDVCYEALNKIDMSYEIFEDVVFGYGYGVGSECLDQPEYPAWFAGVNEERTYFDVFVDETGKLSIVKL